MDRMPTTRIAAVPADLLQIATGREPPDAHSHPPKRSPHGRDGSFAKEVCNACHTAVVERDHISTSDCPVEVLIYLETARRDSRRHFMSRFTNKIVVITGGTSGIGLAAARQFIREGAKVVVAGRSRQSVDSAQNEVGTNGLAITADVTKSAELDSLFQRARENYGRIDVLYVNAASPNWAPSRRRLKKSSMTFSMPTSAAPTSPCRRRCRS
jgi:NADPH:quinone reductase-like Zn-dependent oxidoreductase